MNRIQAQVLFKNYVNQSHLATMKFNGEMKHVRYTLKERKRKGGGGEMGGRWDGRGDERGGEGRGKGREEGRKGGRKRKKKRNL